jgi:hypothetical protein
MAAMVAFADNSKNVSQFLVRAPAQRRISRSKAITGYNARESATSELSDLRGLAQSVSSGSARMFQNLG